MILWALLRSVFKAVLPPKGGRREMRFSDAELRSESAKYSVAIRRLLDAMPRCAAMRSYSKPIGPLTAVDVRF